MGLSIKADDRYRTLGVESQATGNTGRAEYSNEPTGNKIAGLANQINETLSGHVIQIDDTPGQENITIRHNSGSEYVINPNGDIAITSNGDMVTRVSGTATIIVDGDANIESLGNLNLKSKGDMNISCGGDYNLDVDGTKTEMVNSALNQHVYGSYSSVIKGSSSRTVVGAITDAGLGGMNQIVKGEYRQSIEGDFCQGVSGASKMTAKGNLSMSGTDVDIAGSSMSVIGVSGTIGGSGMVHYGQTFYGSTFHGDLNGTAENAVTAKFALNAKASLTTGSPYLGDDPFGGDDPIENDTLATFAMDASIMDVLLNKSPAGIIQVSIDQDDGIKNSIDRSTDNGGLSDRSLTTAEVRSKMRDDANKSNTDFVTTQVGEGRISGTYSKTAPSSIRRLTTSEGSTYTDGKGGNYQTNKDKNTNQFIPNPLYDPNRIEPNVPITTKTLVGKSTPLSTFLSGKEFASLTTRARRLEVARYMAIHAQWFLNPTKTKDFLKGFRLVPVEAFYLAGSEETVTPDGINDYLTKGRAVVYEVHDVNGKQNREKTYELAKWWKDHNFYDKLILDFDTYEPDTSESVSERPVDKAGTPVTTESVKQDQNGTKLSCQVIVVIPEIDSTYKFVSGSYQNKIETRYNGKIQSSELLDLEA